jgi:pyruvyl transferase EpsO
MSPIEMIEALNARIDQVMQPLLAGYRRCALVDFPNYSNVGDSAIWLGEIAFLRRSGIRVVHRASYQSYWRETLKKRIGNNPILINGGGNFGDVWPQLQRFRERIIEEFPNNPIIQFPQSIHFDNDENLRRTQEVIKKHGQVTILARDQHSFDFASRHFQAQVALCPDMAFLLSSQHLPMTPRFRTLVLARTDKEAQGRQPVVPEEGIVVDWLRERKTFALATTQSLCRLMKRHPNHLRFIGGLLGRCFDTVARHRLQRGLNLLSQGRVVVTDRLHAHILCTLLGKPHILVDNNNGKLSNFYRTWTHELDLCQWADSFEEAFGMVSTVELLRVRRQSPCI